jgi:hypothetical protein
MKSFKTLLLVAILNLGVVATTFGDGVAFKGPDLDYSSMRPIKQGEQRAVIVHRNGVEKMLIAVSLELEDEDKGLWIFPVPGNPNTIKLDVLDSFPVFEGIDTWDEAQDLFGDIVKLAFATQIYPTPFVLTSDLSMSKSRSLGAHEEFKVYTHYEVEKWGVHAEAVSAGSIEDLGGYLKEKGVGIETAELRAFEDYLSDKYVLVLAWISSRKELLGEFKEYGKDATLSDKRWPSLYVEFATEKAFYPMRPTSSYGEEPINITLTILDYVQIDVDHPHIYTGYYRQSKAVKDVPSKMTQDLSSKNIRYTRISFHDRARNLSNDLWFIPGAPKYVKNADLIVSVLGNPFGFCVAFICIVSFLSWTTAGLTGLVLFQKWKGYARLGLWNILTLAGLCIASYKVKGIVGERFSQTDRFPGRWTFNVIFSIFYLFIAGYFLYVLMLVLDYLIW